LIPAVQHTLVAEAESKSAAEMWLATGIFAVSKTSCIDVTEVQKLWLKRPKIQVTAKPGEEDEIRVMLY
jgi:predicted RecA/RadA family phage recombinase